MGLLRIAAAGALGYFAFKAWRKRDAQGPATDDDASGNTGSDNRLAGADDTGNAFADDASRTAPHGDPIAANLDDSDADVGGSPQSSRSFGER